jgi:hypothetical protein
MSWSAERLVLLLLAAGCAASAGGGRVAAEGDGGQGKGGGEGGRVLAVDAGGGAGGGRADAAVDSPPAAPDVTPDRGPPDRPSFDFCQPYAAKFCARLGACSAPYLLGVYGDQAGCRARLRLQCETEAALPGSGLTAATAVPCGDAFAAASCDQVFGGAVTACQMKGTAAKGAPCGSGVQCRSGFCRTPETTFCGTCDERAAEGGACDADESCQFPLLCSEAGHCATPAAEGELCNESRPCQAGLLFCAADNTCKRRSGEGRACNRTGAAPLQPCDIGLSCRPSANGTCRAIGFVAAGQACSVPTTASGTLVLCAASGSCVEGTCRPAGDDGQPCTLSPLGDSGGCLAPALCLEGVCKLPDPASCH